MSQQSQVIRFLLALLTALLLSSSAPAQNPKPLSEADLHQLLQWRFDEPVIIAHLQKAGIGQPFDDAAFERLKAAGASEPLRDAVRQAKLQPVPTPVVTVEERVRGREEMTEVQEDQADLLKQLASTDRFVRLFEKRAARARSPELAAGWLANAEKSRLLKEALKAKLRQLSVRMKDLQAQSERFAF